MFSAETLRQLVEDRLPQATAEVHDTTGTNDHFELVVVSPAFEGKGPVDRHRMVYSALGTLVGVEIHALSIQALTPAEAKNKR